MINYVRDSQCDGCFRCGAKFTMIRRRHHCVLCGNIFCNNCSPRVDFRDRRTRKVEIRQRTCERCLKSYSETSKIVGSKFCVDTNVLIGSDKRKVARNRVYTMEPVSVEAYTSTTASIRWSAIQGGLYDLQVAPDTYFSSWEDLRILVDREGDIEDGAGTIGRYVIRGLEPGTRYVVRIARAVGSDRHHKWSSQTRFRTTVDSVASSSSRGREVYRNSNEMKRKSPEKKKSSPTKVVDMNSSKRQRSYKRSKTTELIIPRSTSTKESEEKMNEDDDDVVVSSHDTSMIREENDDDDDDDAADDEPSNKRTTLTAEERKIRNIIMISVVMGCTIQPLIEFVGPFLKLENPVLKILLQNKAITIATVLVMIFSFFTLGLHRMCGCTTLRRRRHSHHPLDRLGLYKNRAFSESDNDSTTSEEKTKDEIEEATRRFSASMRTPVTAVSAALKWRKRVRSSSKRIRKRRWNSGMSSYA